MTGSMAGLITTRIVAVLVLAAWIIVVRSAAPGQWAAGMASGRTRAA